MADNSLLAVDLRPIEYATLDYFNNMYNDEAIRSFLLRKRNSIYTQAMKSQKVRFNVKREDGNMSDFIVDYKVNENFGFPDGSHTKRLKNSLLGYYGRQEFVNNMRSPFLINLSELNVSQDTFKGKCYFFLDGYLCDSIKLYQDYDESYLVILNDKNNGITQNVLNPLIGQDSYYTILVLPYNDFGVSQFVNKTLFFDGDNIKTSIYDIKKFHDPNQIDNWNIFFNFNEKYTGLFIGTDGKSITNSDNLKIDYKFKDYLYSNVNTCKSYLYRDSYIKNKIEIINSRWFSIPLDTILIPMDNIIIWEYDKNNGTKRFCHTAKLVIHYPNVYQITNVSPSCTDFIIEYFWEKSVLTDEYDSKINLYLEYDKNYLDNTRTGTLPAVINSYQPSNVELTMDELLATATTDSRENLYKKMQSILADNPELYTELFSDIAKVNYGKNHTFHISYPSRFFNISVTDNKDQICAYLLQESFNEKHSYFSLRTDNENLDYTIFIDGIICNDSKFYREFGIDYIYIPKRCFNSNSNITIELFEVADQRVQTIDTNYDNTYLFYQDMPEVAASDLLFFTKDNNPISKNDYKFAIDNIFKEYLNDISMRNIKFKGDYYGAYILTNERIVDNKSYDDELYLDYHKKNPTDTFKIINDNSDNDSELKVVNINQHFIKSQHFASGELPCITFKNFKYSHDKFHFRVYINGRLFDRSKYEIKSTGKYNDTLKVLMYSSPMGNEEFDMIVEYLPYEYIEVYKYDYIISGANGYIILDPTIMKPFDMSYYDLYINGKRLSTNNIFIVSNYVIKLVDVNSINNVLICEKIIDSSYIYGDAYTKSNTISVFDQLVINDSNFISFIMKKYKKDSLINNTESNIYAKIGNVSNELYILNEDIFTKGQINPNIQQLTNSDVTGIYAGLLDANNKYLLGVNKYLAMPQRTLFNPNKINRIIEIWTNTGSLNTARNSLAGCGIQSAGLSFGGTVSTELSYNKSTEKFNGSTWVNSGDLNTARGQLAGCGIQSAGLSFGGQYVYKIENGMKYITDSFHTETFNGSAWTNTGDLNTARNSLAGCGTQSAGLSVGGYIDTTKQSLTELFNGSTWNTTGNLNTAKSSLAGCGIQSAGLSFGGYVGTKETPITEKFNGSIWSTSNNLILARRYLAGSGNQSAGLSFGGLPTYDSSSAATEKFNGSIWVTTSNLNNSRYSLAGCGTQGAGLSFGGYKSITFAVTEKFDIKNIF